MTKLIAMGSGGMKPSTPTIGTASDGGTGTTVSVAFTPSTYIGKGTITYTATSSPGGITGTSATSPITVSGLTTGTAYTFTVVGTTNYGVSSDTTAASNSVTPASPSDYEYIAGVDSASTSSISFTSIPSTYKNLVVIANIAVSSNTYLAINGSALTYYTYSSYGNGTGAGTSRFDSSSAFYFGEGVTNLYPANFYGLFSNYTNGSFKRTLLYREGSFTRGNSGFIYHGQGTYDPNYLNISSITITGGTMQYVKANLYGIKG